MSGFVHAAIIELTGNRWATTCRPDGNESNNSWRGDSLWVAVPARYCDEYTLLVTVQHRPPLIISGMHRSGTSLLTRVLEQMGLFVGWRQQQRHHEARFFQRINDWLLAESGGSWEHPQPMIDLLASEEFRAPAVDFLRYNLRTLRSFSFLGPRHWPTHRRLDQGMRSPWGWKDPRTSLTLPLWLEVFPDAKILHIRRHGIDVASSLQVRNERLMRGLQTQFAERRWRYHLVAPRRPHTAGFRLHDIERGIDLWEAYERAAIANLSTLDDQRLLVIRYEDLLDDPAGHLTQIGDFYPISGELATAVAEFDGSRAFAHRRSAELVQVADAHSERLAAFGY